MKRLMYISLFIFAVHIAAFVSLAIAAGEDAKPSIDAAEWSSVESNFFIIYYHPSADIEKIKRSLTTRKLYFDQPARYGNVTTPQEICYRLDRLFNQVEEVLNMYPEMPKTKIIIFKDRDELSREYFKIFGAKDDLKSFYVNKYDTIYTSEADISDSVIIHEMAHAVIDRYFSVIPPKVISEVLAAYVDAYFEE